MTNCPLGSPSTSFHQSPNLNHQVWLMPSPRALSDIHTGCHAMGGTESPVPVPPVASVKASPQMPMSKHHNKGSPRPNSRYTVELLVTCYLRSYFNAHSRIERRYLTEPQTQTSLSRGPATSSEMMTRIHLPRAVGVGATSARLYPTWTATRCPPILGYHCRHWQDYCAEVVDVRHLELLMRGGGI